MQLREIFFNNLRWKVAALFLAVFVWFAIKYAIWRGWRLGGDEETRTFQAQPVMVLSRPEDAGVFQLHAGQVDVLLRGPANLIRDLTTNQVQVFVNMADMPGATITTVHAHAPDGVKVVRVAPPAMAVERLTPPSPSN